MFDLDAQMSLTQAIGLNEDKGTLYPAFGGWYEKSVKDRRTIFNAIDQYTKPGVHFDFPIAYDFIYQISNGAHRRRSHLTSIGLGRIFSEAHARN
jgi:chromosome partitioning protein